jgi:hypothetical protein
MKWILISNTSPGIKEYHLLQDDKVLIVLKCSLEQLSIRIHFEEEHLVYFMEDAGFAGRIIFKNAYGVDLGRFSHNNRNNTGRLHINDDIFDYNIVDNNQPKLIINQHNQQQPLAVCQIPETLKRESAWYEQAGIVLSICQYSSLPAARKEQAYNGRNPV